MDASEQVVLQSVLDGQKDIVASMGMLTDAVKRLIEAVCHVPGKAASESNPTSTVAMSAPPEASPSAPETLSPPAQPPTVTGAQSDSTEPTVYTQLAPNASAMPPDVPGTIHKRMAEPSTTRG